MGGSSPAGRPVDAVLQDLVRRPLNANETSLVRGELAALAADIRRVAGRCDACQSRGGERGPLQPCDDCAVVRYCDSKCLDAGSSAHQLVCNVLAADWEIAEAPLALDPAPLLPLEGILERLRSGDFAQAYEAAAHLAFLLGRCDLAPAGERGLVWDEIAAPAYISNLVSSLESGGLGASRAASVLRPFLDRHNGPQTAATIVVAGALPLLVCAISLPSLHVDLGSIWSLRAAADAATELIGALARQPGLRPAIIEAGAVPALAAHLKLSLEPRPSAWPEFRRPGVASMWGAAAGALAGLSLTDHALVSEEAAAAGLDPASLEHPAPSGGATAAPPMPLPREPCGAGGSGVRARGGRRRGADAEARGAAAPSVRPADPPAQDVRALLKARARGDGGAIGLAKRLAATLYRGFTKSQASYLLLAAAALAVLVIACSRGIGDSAPSPVAYPPAWPSTYGLNPSDYPAGGELSKSGLRPPTSSASPHRHDPGLNGLLPIEALMDAIARQCTDGFLTEAQAGAFIIAGAIPRLIPALGSKSVKVAAEAASSLNRILSDSFDGAVAGQVAGHLSTIIPLLEKGVEPAWQGAKLLDTIFRIVPVGDRKIAFGAVRPLIALLNTK